MTSGTNCDFFAIYDDGRESMSWTPEEVEAEYQRAYEEWKQFKEAKS